MPGRPAAVAEKLLASRVAVPYDKGAHQVSGNGLPSCMEALKGYAPAVGPEPSSMNATQYEAEGGASNDLDEGACLDVFARPALPHRQHQLLEACGRARARAGPSARRRLSWQPSLRSR